MAQKTTYVISVAAELAGMHPQTLRQYDRLGIVTPARTSGRGRRYSNRDVERLREIQRLSQEDGINLAGISRILALEAELAELRAEYEDLEEENSRLLRRALREDRVFAAGPSGDISEIRRGSRPARDTSGVALVRYPARRGLVRRALQPQAVEWLMSLRLVSLD